MRFIHRSCFFREKMKSKIVISKDIIFKLLLVLLSLAAFALVFFPTQRARIGITPDSVQYIGTSRNLLEGKGFLEYNNSPLLFWPPLYPIVLAIFGFIFKRDPLLLANIINSILFGLIVFYSGTLAFKLTKKSFVFAFLASLTIVFSIPLYGVTTMVFSETLFIFLIVLFFKFLDLFSTNHRIGTLLILAFITALASLTRYIGVVLIPIGIVCIFFTIESKRKERLLRTGIFAIVSLLPISAWITRNQIISGTFSGPRSLSVFSLLDQFHSMTASFFSWFFPKELFDSQIFIAVVFLSIGILIGVLHKELRVRNVFRSTTLVALFSFLGLYLISLIVSARSGYWQLIDSRYLAPLFVPITLLFFSFTNHITSIFYERFRSQLMYPIVISFLLVLVAFPVSTTIKNIKNIGFFRLGFNTQNIYDSSTLKFLLNQPEVINKCTIYTNNPIQVDFLAHFPATMSPAKTTGDYTSIVVEDISSLRGSWPNQQACIIWFNTIQNDNLYSISELERIVNLEVLHSFDDGIIYQIEKK